MAARCREFIFEMRTTTDLTCAAIVRTRCGRRGGISEGDDDLEPLAISAEAWAGVGGFNDVVNPLSDLCQRVEDLVWCREISQHQRNSKGQHLPTGSVPICPRTTGNRSPFSRRTRYREHSLCVLLLGRSAHHPTTRAAHRPGGLILLVRYQMRMITFPRRRLKTQRQARDQQLP